MTKKSSSGFLNRLHFLGDYTVVLFNSLFCRTKGRHSALLSGLLFFCAAILLTAGVAFAAPPSEPGGGNDNGSGESGDSNGGEPEEEVRSQEEIRQEQEALEEQLQEISDFNEQILNGESIQEQADFASVTGCEGLEEYFESLVQNEDKKFGILRCRQNDVCQYDCQYSRVWSCFPPETLIQMSDGSTKRIDKIQTGDMVWNPASQKAMRVGNTLNGPEDKPLVQIGYGDTTVKVTQTHPMVTRSPLLQDSAFRPASLRSFDSQGETLNARVKKAGEVTLNDWIMGADGEFHKVTKVETLKQVEGQIVFNFELETDSKALADHMIVADGIVTGDVTVQAELNNYKLPWQD